MCGCAGSVEYCNKCLFHAKWFNCVLSFVVNFLVDKRCMFARLCGLFIDRQLLNVTCADPGIFVRGGGGGGGPGQSDKKKL